MLELLAKVTVLDVLTVKLPPDKIKLPKIVLSLAVLGETLLAKSTEL